MRDQLWRLAQGHELLLRFDQTHRSNARSLDEVRDWLVLAPVERPVRPSDAALERAKHTERLALAAAVADFVDVDRAD